jgi:CubicO group peptidase (beta-lactamase class C family)
MTAGLAWSEAGSYAGSENDGARMGRSADPTRFVLERPVVAAPGTRWNYSGGQTHLLAEVVRRVTGKPLLAFARDALFTPLGITDVEWVPYEGSELPDADSGLRLRPRDALKLGLLYAAGGRWQERQVIPAAWVAASLRRSVAATDSLVELGSGALMELGYARQWWHARYDLPYGRFIVHWAAGNGGQLVLVAPAERLVVVVTGGRYNRVLPWAMGLGDSTYRFPIQRTVRRVAPGEWAEVALADAERARYVGTYRYDRDTVRVWDEGGVLRMSAFGDDRGDPFDLVPMGGHVFAWGRYEGGRLTRVYWPDDRVTFVADRARVTGFFDHDLSGHVYGRAVRVQ